mmetsp:Transcript_29108/g.57144  ORF Transcript_29108/g.57144 Transcript_29108/m.57144 type:complete len:135 (+) Transcript_29108:106-510(+)
MGMRRIGTPNAKLLAMSVGVSTWNGAGGCGITAQSFVVETNGKVRRFLPQVLYCANRTSQTCADLKVTPSTASRLLTKTGWRSTVPRFAAQFPLQGTRQISNSTAEPTARHRDSHSDSASEEERVLDPAKIEEM